MPLKVELSVAAEEDLLAAWNYISHDDMDAADALLDRVAAVCRKLADWPDLGRERLDLGQEMRSFPVETHVVYYRVNSEIVEVVRVLHGRRDVDAVL